MKRIFGKKSHSKIYGIFTHSPFIFSGTLISLHKSYISTGSKHKLRSRTVEINQLFISTGNMDTLIFLNENHTKFHLIFEIINQQARQKSILVIKKSDMENFKTTASKFAKNSYFYLLVFEKSPSTISWYTIMTFYNSSQFIMNKIKFDENGMGIENYNMQGMEIVATSLDWQPFIAHRDHP